MTGVQEASHLAQLNEQGSLLWLRWAGAGQWEGGVKAVAYSRCERVNSKYSRDSWGRWIANGWLGSQWRHLRNDLARCQRWEDFC